MTISITMGDIEVARERAVDTRSHLWHNPIAVAVEREHGGFAVVTSSRLFLHSDTFQCALMLTDPGKRFMHEWSRGREKPAYALFVADEQLAL